MENLAKDARISQFFTEEFERQRRIGFPSLRCFKFWQEVAEYEAFDNSQA